MSQKMETPKNVTDKGQEAETHFGFEPKAPRNLTINFALQWFVGHIELRIPILFYHEGQIC